MTSRLELRLTATRTSVRRVRNEVAEVAAGFGAGDGLVQDVRLCVTEAATNVVRHAYPSGDGGFSVSVDDAFGRLVVVVRDYGIGFSGFGRGSDHDDGHGLRIIETLTESWSISGAPGGGTELRMEFRLDQPSSEAS
jgi:anti-sigma regulatory factor (Ser/Thr protein kinase)